MLNWKTVRQSIKRLKDWGRFYSKPRKKLMRTRELGNSTGGIKDTVCRTLCL